MDIKAQKSRDGSCSITKKSEKWLALATGAALAAMIAGARTPALAGSDNSSDTYAADINGLVLPPGTFLAIEYLGYRHGDSYVTTPNNIFAKTLGGGKEIDGSFELFSSITRFSYFTRLFDHPLVIEAAGTFANISEARVGNEHLSSANGFLDPVVFVTYGLINEPKNERFLGLTNYLYLPWGRRYDKFKGANVSTPDQTTWVPQIAYAEGLAKFGLPNVWIDVIANASIHSDGDSPLAVAPGVQFDNLSQDNSYDIKAFLRYEFAQPAHIAIGIEKSWGGDQIASGGVLGAKFGPTSLGKDDFLKGHVQLAFPLAPDFHVATDLTHDFEREGGFKEDFTAEVRLSKILLPAKPMEEPLK
jgi:hypothetical protein